MRALDHDDFDQHHIDIDIEHVEHVEHVVDFVDVQHFDHVLDHFVDQHHFIDDEHHEHDEHDAAVHSKELRRLLRFVT